MFIQLLFRADGSKEESQPSQEATDSEANAGGDDMR